MILTNICTCGEKLNPQVPEGHDYETGIYRIGTVGAEENKTMCAKFKTFVCGNRTSFDCIT